MHSSIALRYATDCACRFPIGRMRPVESIRLDRLKELLQRFGSFAEMNRLLGRPARDATLSQIVHSAPDSKTTKPRALGSIQARHIEQTLKLPEGWMDADPEAWPFKHIARERFEVLHDHQKIEIQGQVRTMIVRFENENQPNVKEFEPLKAVATSAAPKGKPTKKATP